jgi:hypothetical protein
MGIGAQAGPAGRIGPKLILIQIIPSYFAIFSYAAIEILNSNQI